MSALRRSVELMNVGMGSRGVRSNCLLHACFLARRLILNSREQQKTLFLWDPINTMAPSKALPPFLLG